VDYIWGTFLVGANYWPSKGNIRSWTKWNPSAVREDLRRAKEIGIKPLRFFLLAQDCSDEEGRLRDTCSSSVKEFISLVEQEGISLFPTLLVGHMSGKNWPLPWGDTYSHNSIERERRFVREVVELIGKSHHVRGWVLTNEVTLHQRPSSPEQLKVWFDSLASVIRTMDPRPISLGDNLSPFAPAYLKPENFRDSVDYFSPHIYLYDVDPVKHTMLYLATIEYDRSLGKVLLEEFGLPTSNYSEESQAGFLDVILHGSLLYGAQGALVWCLSDFDAPGDEPYLWEPHELTFGVLRADLSPKPAAEVIRKFSEKLSKVDLSQFKVPERSAAILVPHWFWRDYPFVPEGEYRNDMWRAMGQSFVNSRSAGIQVTFTREEDQWPYKLLILPSVPRLLSTTWRRLLRYVEGGGTLYYSTARTVWHSSATDMWEELFGVTPDLNAGSPGLMLDDLVLKVENREIRFKGRALTYSMRPRDAKVLGKDEGGRPLLFVVERGKGKAILSLIPVELLSSGELWPYDWLRDMSNLPSMLTGHRDVEVQYLEGKGEFLVGVMNHSFEERKLEIKLTPQRVELEPIPKTLGPKSASLSLMAL